MSDLVKRLRIKAGMIEMGELIAWGSDIALMREAADALEATVRGAREDYKLVPVEPTPEMLEAGEYAQYTGCYVSGIYADMLAAAPAVQGELCVKWAPEEVANGNKGIRWVSDEGVHGRPTDHDCRVYLESNPNARGCHCPECTMLYAVPQPAAHQPCPESVREGAPYDDPAFEAVCREYGIWGTAAAAQCAVFWEAGKRVAEQRAAPDVAGLDESPIDVIYTDGCGAGRRSPADCRYGISYVTVADTVYWPLSADDAQRLRSAECGRAISPDLPMNVRKYQHWWRRWR